MAPGTPLSLTIAIIAGYAVVGMVLLFTAYRQLNGTPKSILYRPTVSLFAVMAMVHSAMPIAEIVAGTYTYQPGYSVEAHLMSWVATILGAFSVLLGYIAFRKASRASSSMPPAKARRHESISFLLLVVVPSLYACYRLYSLVAAVGYEEFLRDRIGYRADSQEWVLLSNMVVVVPAFYTASYLADPGNKRALVSAIASFVISAFFILTTGSRNSVFLAIVCVSLTYLFFKARLISAQTLRITGLAGVGALLLAFYGEYRRAAVGLGDGGIPTSATTIVRATSGAFGNHELLLWLADNRAERFYGASYLAGFTVFVPRSIWPEKPLGGGPRIKNQVEPGSYEVGRRGTSSFTTGFLVEAWMNFGLLGPLFVGLCWGAVVALVAGFTRNADNPYSIALASFLVLTTCVLVVYSEFLGLMARAVPVTVGLIAAQAFGRGLLTRRRQQIPQRVNMWPN